MIAAQRKLPIAAQVARIGVRPVAVEELAGVSGTDGARVCFVRLDFSAAAAAMILA
jgi:hypothetical protein